MLDSYSPNPKLTAEWQDHLTCGDIVSFRFPVEGDPEAVLEPKKRPCLVIDRRVIGSLPYVTLAFGTSAYHQKTRGYGVDIINPARVISAGLHQPTRFICYRKVSVPLNHIDFVRNKAIESPVLGTLSGPEFERMNQVRARLQAEADIAAEHRARRRIYGRRKAKPLTVAVEYTRRKRLT
ncbi:hypothetical protein [Candidatus Halocynthiibacter alkanivorans]|uniref:hypothetical protein n=1 Tax=Candidatus Halocynthiibacter alkanivorans TaxID=2267619 RepID=UPI00109C2C9C|nr:hypothetical protein [Candidatus Halocynthiibacter alkanivorans]